MAMTRGLVALLALLAAGSAPAAAEDREISPHAYYLYLADQPRGCEDCYVPLLVSRDTLEAISASGRDAAVVLITTYERDSIWTLERDVPLAAADVAARERILRLRGRRYRYQEAAPAEILRLLARPEGSIPIHRPAPAPDKKTLEELIAVFTRKTP